MHSGSLQLVDGLPADVLGYVRADVLGYVRSIDGETLRVMLNFSDRVQTLPMDTGSELLSTDSRNHVHGGTLYLHPNSAIVVASASRASRR